MMKAVKILDRVTHKSFSWFVGKGKCPIDINRLRQCTALEFGTPVTQG